MLLQRSKRQRAEVPGDGARGLQRSAPTSTRNVSAVFAPADEIRRKAGSDSGNSWMQGGRSRDQEHHRLAERETGRAAVVEVKPGQFGRRRVYSAAEVGASGASGALLAAVGPRGRKLTPAAMAHAARTPGPRRSRGRDAPQPRALRAARSRPAPGSGSRWPGGCLRRSGRASPGEALAQGLRVTRCRTLLRPAAATTWGTSSV